MQLLRRLGAILMILLGIATPLHAVTLLRDSDIEYALNRLARPVLTAAGLPASSIDVLVIDDDTYNAYIVDNRHIFIHSGLLLKLTNAAQLQSVLAHEAAHIANGHIARRTLNAQSAQTLAGLGMALAAAAAVSTGNGAAAAGLGAGLSSSVQRSFMAHTRAEESAADNSGMRYMIGAGVDPKAFMEVLDIFRGQELVTETRQDPYARTHPLSRDRIRNIAALATSVTPSKQPDPQADYWFARAHGKLSAYQRAPSWTLRRAAASVSPDIRLLREAVAYHRVPDTARAIAAVDKLVAMRPQDAFVHDLRGQILLESRKPGAAIAAYQTASKLAPNDALILGGYGRALLAANQFKQAQTVLEKARAKDSTDTRLLRDLAVAYAQLKQNGMASLVTAERYALLGRPKDALIHANRADGLLPRGSAPWLRAQDVISASEAAAKQRN